MKDMVESDAYRELVEVRGQTFQVRRLSMVEGFEIFASQAGDGMSSASFNHKLVAACVRDEQGEPIDNMSIGVAIQLLPHVFRINDIDASGNA